MIAAAHGRVRSARWRLAIGALFALGAALTLNSPAAGLSWYLALALAMAFDFALGQSFLSARSAKERVTTGALFVGGSVFSIVVFAAMPILLAFNGGEAGRVLGVLMAASSLVSLTLVNFHAPRFMLVTAAPAIAALVLMPAIPASADAVGALSGALGVGCGVAGFLVCVGRAALGNTRRVASWRTAHEMASERQREAEAKRAEAEAASRARSELLAVMTRELRAPLKAVIDYAEIVQEGLNADGRKDFAGDAARITSSARHLLGAIDRIVDLSNGDGGEVLVLRETRSVPRPSPGGGNARSAGGG